MLFAETLALRKSEKVCAHASRAKLDSRVVPFGGSNTKRDRESGTAQESWCLDVCNCKDFKQDLGWIVGGE